MKHHQKKYANISFHKVDSRLHPIHVKTIDGFYAPFYKFINLGVYDTAELAGLEYQKALKIKNQGGKVLPTENIKISEVGFKGIYKSGNNFRVRMCINGVNKDLGTFSNIELANERYLEAKKLISELKSIEHFFPKKSPNKIYKGVFKKGNKYQAKLTIKGKTNNLGSYDNPESARDIYEKAVALLNQGRDIEHLIKEKKDYKIAFLF